MDVLRSEGANASQKTKQRILPIASLPVLTSTLPVCTGILLTSKSEKFGIFFLFKFRHLFRGIGHFAALYSHHIGSSHHPSMISNNSQRIPGLIDSSRASQSDPSASIEWMHYELLQASDTFSSDSKLPWKQVLQSLSSQIQMSEKANNQWERINLYEILRDGKCLYLLAFAIQKSGRCSIQDEGLQRRVFKATVQRSLVKNSTFHCMERVQLFLRWCRELVHLEEHLIFTNVQLLEEKNEQAICSCLDALRHRFDVRNASPNVQNPAEEEEEVLPQDDESILKDLNVFEERQLADEDAGISNTSQSTRSGRLGMFLNRFTSKSVKMLKESVSSPKLIQGTVIPQEDNQESNCEGLRFDSLESDSEHAECVDEKECFSVESIQNQVNPVQRSLARRPSKLAAFLATMPMPQNATVIVSANVPHDTNAREREVESEVDDNTDTEGSEGHVEALCDGDVTSSERDTLRSDIESETQEDEDLDMKDAQVEAEDEDEEREEEEEEEEADVSETKIYDNSIDFHQDSESDNQRPKESIPANPQEFICNAKSEQSVKTDDTKVSYEIEQYAPLLEERMDDTSSRKESDSIDEQETVILSVNGEVSIDTSNSVSKAMESNMIDETVHECISLAKEAIETEEIPSPHAKEKIPSELNTLRDQLREDRIGFEREREEFRNEISKMENERFILENAVKRQRESVAELNMKLSVSEREKKVAMENEEAARYAAKIAFEARDQIELQLRLMKTQ